MDGSSLAAGVAGQLDSTFGTGGVVLTPAGGNDCGADCVAVQADGKLVASGFVFVFSDPSHTSGMPCFALVRYNPDGSADEGFGSRGILLPPIGYWTSVLNAVAIQPDGRIVAACGSYDPSVGLFFTVVRYGTDGRLDTGFGSKGVASVRVGEGSSMPAAIAFDAGGKILVGGKARVGGVEAFGLARFQVDGTLDPTFGSGGTVTTRVSEKGSSVSALLIQTSGKIVATGRAVTEDERTGFGLARYNVDGSLDAGFGSGGLVRAKVDGGLMGQLFGAAVQADDSIVTAGPAYGGVDSSSTPVMALMRHGADGVLDPSFGQGGLVKASVAGSATWATSVVAAAGGKLVAAGLVQNPDEKAFCLTRFRPDGTLDTAFGKDGWVVTKPTSGDSYVRSLALQADGKIVAAGHGGGADFALARYLGG